MRYTVSEIGIKTERERERRKRKIIKEWEERKEEEMFRESEIE